MTMKVIKNRALSRSGMAVAAVTAATMMVAGGAALATIPGGDGTINGCYDAGAPPPHSLSIVDNPAACTGTLLVWSQTGPAGPAGPQGATGATGAQGAAGPAGASGVNTAPLVGGLGGITTTPTYKFAGPTAVVDTLAGQRMTGTTVAAMRLGGGKPKAIDSGLCYRPSAGGTISNFVGNAFITHLVDSRPGQLYSAAASVVPGAGSWRVGFCVRNGNGGATSVALRNNGSLNGWIMVTN